jgi:hypothetical protein
MKANNRKYETYLYIQECHDQIPQNEKYLVTFDHDQCNTDDAGGEKDRLDDAHHISFRPPGSGRHRHPTAEFALCHQWKKLIGRIMTNKEKELRFMEVSVFFVNIISLMFIPLTLHVLLDFCESTNVVFCSRSKEVSITALCVARYFFSENGEK